MRITHTIQLKVALIIAGGDHRGIGLNSGLRNNVLIVRTRMHNADVPGSAAIDRCADDLDIATSADKTMRKARFHQFFSNAFCRVALGHSAGIELEIRVVEVYGFLFRIQNEIIDIAMLGRRFQRCLCGQGNRGMGSGIAMRRIVLVFFLFRNSRLTRVMPKRQRCAHGNVHLAECFRIVLFAEREHRKKIILYGYRRLRGRFIQGHQVCDTLIFLVVIIKLMQSLKFRPTERKIAIEFFFIFCIRDELNHRIKSIIKGAGIFVPFGPIFAIYPGALPRKRHFFQRFSRELRPLGISRNRRGCRRIALLLAIRLCRRLATRQQAHRYSKRNRFFDKFHDSSLSLPPCLAGTA